MTWFLPAPGDPQAHTNTVSNNRKNENKIMRRDRAVGRAIADEEEI